MKKWRFEAMAPHDLEEAVKAFPVAWLSLSPLEWHGEALAFGCDPALGYELARLAWERTGGVLLPPLYIGTGNNFRRAGDGTGGAGRWEAEALEDPPNPGSIFVRPVTLELVLRDYLFFLGREGFRLCVVVSGHGAMAHMLAVMSVCEAVDAAFREGRGTLRTHVWRGDAAALPKELQFPGAGDHADFSEASALGAIDPSLVDRTRFGLHARDRAIGLDPGNAGEIDFEKGRRVLAALAEGLAKDVAAMLGELGIPGPDVGRA